MRKSRERKIDKIQRIMKERSEIKETIERKRDRGITTDTTYTMFFERERERERESVNRKRERM